MRVDFHQDGLSSGWSFIREVFNPGDLYSERSFVTEVFDQDFAASR